MWHNRVHKRENTVVLIRIKEKGYPCSKCARSFTKQIYLTAHIGCVHKHEKTSFCNKSGKSVVVESGLEKHKRFHTGKKPYSCERCGKLEGGDICDL